MPLPLENTAQSARASALGSAFTSVNGDLYDLYLNPAGLAALRFSQVSLLYQSLTGGMFQETLTTAFPLSRTGVLALGLDTLNFGNLQGLDMNGVPFQNPFRSSLSLGLGLQLDPAFSIGFSTRYSYQFLSPNSDSLSPSTSAGILWSASSEWRFGAFYASNDSQSPVGTGIFKIGSSWSGSLLDQNPALLSLDFALPSNGLNQVQLGLEVYLIKEIAVRVGYQQDLVTDPLNGFQGLTGGVGINLFPFTLDYSLAPMGNRGLYQAVDLTYSLSEKKDEPIESSNNNLILTMTQSPTPSSGIESPTNTYTPTLSVTKSPTPLSGTLTSAPTQEPESITPSPTPASITTPKPAAAPTHFTSILPSPSPTSTPPPVRFKPAPKGLSSNKIILKKVRFKLPNASPVAATTPSPELEKKIAALSDKVSQNPKDAEAWIALGNLYWKNGQGDFAAQCFEEALAIWPKNQSLIDWLKKYKANEHARE